MLLSYRNTVLHKITKKFTIANVQNRINWVSFCRQCVLAIRVSDTHGNMYEWRPTAICDGDTGHGWTHCQPTPARGREVNLRLEMFSQLHHYFTLHTGKRFVNVQCTHIMYVFLALFNA